MIISTTLTANSETIIGDALRSALPLVDRCLVVDTGVTDGTIEVARAVAGDRLRIARFAPSGVFDFAAARNYALAQARVLGATWAITLDTDERLAGRDQLAFRHELLAMTADVGMAFHVDGSYAKERVITCKPSRATWVGYTHEALVQVSRTTLTTLRFDELPKTREQSAAKFARDVKALKKQLAEAPEDGRWWFYLGESLTNLGQFDQAGKAYMRCFELNGWDEERAWSAYKMAEYYAVQKQDYQRSVQWCARGLAVHAGFAELAWLAGWCSFQLGNARDAVFWSRMAKAVAEAEKGEGKLKRLGFRYQPAYDGGPDDVEEHAWRRLDGKPTESAVP